MWTSLLLTILLPPLLVPLLGHRDFRQREAAQRALAAFGTLARPCLERAAESHPDPEVRKRAQTLQRPEWVAEAIEAKSRRILPRGYPRLPWLHPTHWWDPDGCRIVVSPYFQAACEASGLGGPPDWAGQREATRLWVVAQYQQGRSRRQILDGLDEMAREEICWIRENGKNFMPPLTLPAGVK